MGVNGHGAVIVQDADIVRLLFKCLVIDPPVSFEGNPVDRRKFNNSDPQSRTLWNDAHRFKQTAGLEVLQCIIDLTRLIFFSCPWLKVSNGCSNTSPSTP